MAWTSISHVRASRFIYVTLNPACNRSTPTKLKAPGTLNTSCRSRAVSRREQKLDRSRVV